MIRHDKEYFDTTGRMSPYGENGVLFTSEYVMLLRLLGADMPLDAPVLAERAIEATANQPDPLSHDNMTGIVCLSKNLRLDYEKNYFHQDWWRRLHPRDIGFYLYALIRSWMPGNVGKLLSLPFLFPTFLAQLWACWHKEQSGGDLDTDGKLLAWLRIETYDMTISRWLCTKILLWRHKLNWASIFMIYFRSLSHPNVRLALRYYGFSSDKKEFGNEAK